LPDLRPAAPERRYALGIAAVRSFLPDRRRLGAPPARPKTWPEA